MNGCFGWAQLDKLRPVIVLLQRDESLLVVWGTSTAGRDYGGIKIDHRCRAGRRLRLTGPTHFYATCQARILVTSFTSHGQCPLDLFHELESHVRNADPKTIVVRRYD